MGFASLLNLNSNILVEGNDRSNTFIQTRSVKTSKKELSKIVNDWKEIILSAKSSILEGEGGWLHYHFSVRQAAWLGYRVGLFQLTSYYYFGFAVTCSLSIPASGLACFTELGCRGCRAGKYSCNCKFHNSARQSGWKSEYEHARIAQLKQK